MINRNITGLQDTATKRWLQVEMYFALKEENWERLEYLATRAKALIRYGDKLAKMAKQDIEQSKKELD